MYIDTEGSFTAIRAAEMAEELSSHILKATINKLMKENKTKGVDLTSMSRTQLLEFADGSVLDDEDKTPLQSALMCTRDHLLSGIHIIRVHDLTELIASIRCLDQRIQLNKKIKLVIIDSIAFHLRQEEKGNVKARILANITQNLNVLCFDHGIACVVTNHMTTHVDKVGYITHVVHICTCICMYYLSCFHLYTIICT